MTDQQVADHWIKQIDRILENDIRFAYEQWPGGIRALKGIKETIKKSGKVSREQIQAIKNIRYGKN